MDALLPVAVIALWLAFFTVVPIYITWRMGQRRGRHGWVWGLLLGWLGVLLLKLNFPPKRTRPPAGAE